MSKSSAGKPGDKNGQEDYSTKVKKELDERTVPDPQSNLDITLSLTDLPEPHFVLLRSQKEKRKIPIRTGWQLTPTDPNLIVPHLNRGGGIGIMSKEQGDGTQLVCLDVDQLELKRAFEVAPELKEWPLIRHDAKPLRGKFLMKIVGGQLDNRSHKVRCISEEKPLGKFKTFVELLAYHKQSVLPPSLHPDGPMYLWANVDLGLRLPELTIAEFENLWARLVAACPQDAPLPQQSAPEKESKKGPIVMLSSDTSNYDTFDWRAFADDVASKFDVMAYIKKHFGGRERPSLGGIKFDGNGGLFVKPDGSWYNFRDQTGGGPFQIVSYNLYGHNDASANWSEVLKEAAGFAGVCWPNFRKLGCTHEDALNIAEQMADNFTVIELTEDEYLSDKFDYNQCAFGKVTHIIGGTGIGKTTAADTVTIRTFLTPYSEQAKAFASDANERGVRAAFVVGGHDHDGSAITYGTYDAAKKELKLFNQGEIRFAGRTLIVDEIHHNNQDAFRNSTALDPLSILINCYLHNGGRVITLTGTPSPSYPFLLDYKGSDVVYIKKPRPIRNLQLFKQSDAVEAVRSAIKSGCTHIVYYVDDRTKCEAYAEKLTPIGIKAYPIHAHNKNTPHHQELVGGNWGEGIVTYVCTRAMVDGHSLKIPAPEGAKLGVMFDKSLQFGSTLMEQAAGRVRNVVPKIFVGMTDKALERLGQGGHFDFMKELEKERALLDDYVEIAKRMKLREVDSRLLQGDSIDVANQIAKKIVLEEFKGKIVFDETGEIVRDEQALHQRVTAKWIAAAHAAPDILINEMNAYGYSYKGMLDLTGNEISAKVRNDLIKLEKKARRESDLEMIKQQTESLDLLRARAVREQATSLIKEKGDEGRAQVAAAGLLIRLTNAGLAESAAKQQIQGLTSKSERKIKRIENVIKMARIRQTLTHPDLFKRGDPKTLFFATLQDGYTFKIGEVLTPNQMVQRVRTVANAYGVPDMASEKLYGDSRKLVILLQDIYHLKRNNKKVDGEKTNVYEFQGFIEVELREVASSQNPHLYTEKEGFVKNQQPITPLPSPTQSQNRAAAGCRDRALDFWLREMERGVEEGWLEKWAYESFRDHTKNGRVTVDEIKEAYEWMHEDTCNYYLAECSKLVDEAGHSQEARALYLVAMAFMHDPKALKEHYEKMALELFW